MNAAGGLGLAPATELAEMISRKEISSAELLESYLDRVDALNPALNAVVTLDVETARQRCRALDALSMRGESAGPLHGLPITIKDAIATQGIRSTSGAAGLQNHVPVRDAPAVRRLRDAGAVVFGKTNLPTWSSDVETQNELFGVTRNPWDLERTPGGSSGGSAAAVAAGLSALELGSDIGGSVRIPAGFCGVYSHKPTYGIVPQEGYMDRPDGTSSIADLNVLGPITRSVRDLEVALSVLAGLSAGRPAGWNLSLPPARFHELSRFRIAWWFHEPLVPLDPEVAEVLADVVGRLTDAKAAIEESHPDVDFETSVDVYRSLVYAAASVHHPEPAATTLGGTHRAWLDLDYVRRGLRTAWEAWFEDYDVLLCPVVPVAAPRLGQASRLRTVGGPDDRPHLHYTAWTGMVGAVHLPSTVVPVGLTRGGLPVGVQVVSRRYNDLTCLRVATLLDEVIDGYRRPPLPTT